MSGCPGAVSDHISYRSAVSQKAHLPLIVHIDTETEALDLGVFTTRNDRWYIGMWSHLTTIPTPKQKFVAK